MRGFNSVLKLCLLLCLVGVSTLPGKVDAEEEPPTILFDLLAGQTFINGQLTELEVPAMVINNRLFVPVRFLSEQLGFDVSWDDVTRTIKILTKKVMIKLDQDHNQAWINDAPVPFDQIGVIVKDKLLLSARTMSDYSDLQIDYNEKLHQVTIKPKELKPGNSKPIAQFTTDKSVYRIGEPIQYKDLSYDPDANGYFPTWQGKQMAFFTPGDHIVILTVKDTFGSISEPYSRTIHVSNETLTTREEFPFYFGAAGDDSNRIPIDINRFWNFPVLEKTETKDTSRKLIVSNSPETFEQYGIVYDEKVSGKFRLYATHINGMKKMAKLYIMATNTTNQPVTIHKTHKAEVLPSTYPQILGEQGLVEWFLQDHSADEQLVVQPGESVVYYQSNPLFPMQGVHLIQDIEVDGEAQFTFFVNNSDLDTKDFALLPRLDRQGHVRGTYDASDIQWNVDASRLNGQPSRIVVGGTGSNNWVEGRDGMTGAFEQNMGNYGVFYDITIQRPGKAAIALVPRGGAFKGTLLYNGQIISLPKSGVIDTRTAYLIDRTKGDEEQIKITLSPPSGSSLPFDILIYPLDDRK